MKLGAISCMYGKLTPALTESSVAPRVNELHYYLGTVVALANPNPDTSDSKNEK